MYLTISKRFEFCSSRRLARRDRNDGQNMLAFGPSAIAAHGAGDNFVFHLVFHGPVDEKSGMMISIKTIKERIVTLLDERFDHRYLNVETPPFDVKPPSLELIAQTILEESTHLFKGESAQPVACHLQESKSDSCTAFIDGRVERHFSIIFSAARRTYSPLISDEENKSLFGSAARQNGHGHDYQLRATVSGDLHPTYGTIISFEKSNRVLGDLYNNLNHRHLNRDIKEFHKQPLTTEILSRHIYVKLSNHLPITRVCLHELDNFFVSYDSESTVTAGLTSEFQSTHRLASKHFSKKNNAELYGKCNNEHSHGHRYIVEASATGTIDEETGTILNLGERNKELQLALSAYHLRHLDQETEDFIDQPSTGENIAQALWPRVNSALGKKLVRLRLWETPNNRFTLRNSEPKTD